MCVIFVISFKAYITVVTEVFHFSVRYPSIAVVSCWFIVTLFRYMYIKSYQNRIWIDKVIEKIKVVQFLPYSVLLHFTWLYVYTFVYWQELSFMFTHLCTDRNYPSAENIARKAQERKERQARGEVLNTKHNLWVIVTPQLGCSYCLIVTPQLGCSYCLSSNVAMKLHAKFRVWLIDVLLEWRKCEHCLF